MKERPNEQSIMQWLGFLRCKAKDPLPAKDPMDWKLTTSSSEWSTDNYCPNCKHSTTHRERMADICNNCGHSGNMSKYRSYRKIRNGEKWMRQFKYGNSPKDYELVEDPEFWRAGPGGWSGLHGAGRDV